MPSWASSVRSNTPRDEETLPPPIAVNLVPSGPFGFAAHDQLLWDIFFLFPFQKIHGQGGSARNLLGLITNPQQAELLSVPGSTRSNAFWGELRHTLRARTKTFFLT